jgi:monofunctional biosynthetic peptidoglycan transglycosylase
MIAAEDSHFVEHEGFDWDGIQQALEKNQKKGRIVAGGSTITQQLAKNLFLSGERNLVRKGQELVLSYALEAILGKRRILEIYLNAVEWGEGVFGAEAAAERYFGVPASRLGTQQAATLAVMLPAPKRFEKRPQSPYAVGRAATIAARMGQVELP